MFLARRSARFFAAALLSAILFSMTASSSLVKGRNVGRLLSESFSAPDMVAGPKMAEDEADERCSQELRRRARGGRGGGTLPWLEEARRPTTATTHSFASSCTSSVGWSCAPGCRRFSFFEDTTFRKYSIDRNVSLCLSTTGLFPHILRRCQPHFMCSLTGHLQRDNPLRCALLTPLMPLEFPRSSPSAVGGGEYSEERSAAREKGHLPDRWSFSLKFKSYKIYLLLTCSFTQAFFYRWMVVCSRRLATWSLKGKGSYDMNERGTW